MRRKRLSGLNRPHIYSAIGEFLWYLAKSDDLEFMKHYAQNYGAFVKTDEHGRVAAAYGPRLFAWDGVDQIGQVIELLSRKRSSKQAVIQLFDRGDLSPGARDVPCTCTLQFLCRDNRLDLIAVNRLNPIIGATGYSYYDRIDPACHIDLLPFATDAKWGTLASGRRQRILRDNSDLLLQLIQSSNLKMIILNGQSVVNEFISATGAELEIEDMPSWALPRTNGGKVSGTAYYGICEELNGIELKAPLKVLGFNHNIQSSFGVTTTVIRNIADWVKTQGRTLEFA